MKHWYVYVALYKEEIVYIGKGKDDRYLHLNSGVSNCYEANRVHFEGNRINVTVHASFLSEKSALAFEKELILEFRPLWNITYTGKQNARGKDSPNKRFFKKGSSKYMGVTYKSNPSGGKNAQTRAKHWRAKVHYKGKNYHVGYFEREIDAAISRDLYLINNKWQGFILNFPDKNYAEILDEYVEWD